MGLRPSSAFPLTKVQLPRLKIRSSLVPRQLGKWSFTSIYLLLAFSLWILSCFYKPIYNLPTFGSPKTAPTINLVLAAIKGQDYAWATKLNMTNLQLYPYIANDPDAAYHPRQNKGREAMVILTYLHDFYDALPDISIFTHADDFAWHNDVVMENSLSWIINNLDLEEVLRREYLSLRVDWENACPDWISMSMSVDSPQYTDLKREEPLMAEAFRKYFPNDAVPEIMAGPCCSQFAVTRSAIQKIPKEEYARYIELLLATELGDDLSGRIWEHWWQYIFLGKAIDCPVEYKALCRGWHVCFEHQWEFEDYNVLVRLKSEKEGEINEVQNAHRVDKHKLDLLNWKMRDLKRDIETRRSRAVDNGRIKAKRLEIVEDF